MPLQKICNRCKKEQDVQSFYRNKRMKDGLNTFCISCHKADNVLRKARNRSAPAFREQEQAWKKEYRSKTTAQRAAYIAEWRARNKDRVLSYSKEYRDTHKEYFYFACQKRKIDLLNRLPPWVDSEEMWLIKEAYSLAALRTRMLGFAWHVDHVLPLRGKNVSGLHVPNNLRVIPAIDNMRKTNKYEI